MFDDEESEDTRDVVVRTDRVCLSMAFSGSSVSRDRMAYYPERVRHPHCCVLTLPQHVISDAPCVSDQKV